MDRAEWPPLPLDEWEPTYLTLHRFTQIIGKVKLALSPWLNHWWHTTLQVTAEGLTTGSMPAGGRDLTMTLDLREHELVAHTSDRRGGSLALERMTVAEFYRRTTELLHHLGVEVRIWPVPVEVADTTPFPDDHHHCAYDRDPVERLHRILLNVDRVFRVHRGSFLGKASPVHFFWGAFDLAVSRFSGQANPSPPPGRIMEAAYSHEVISHGFWPGGDWPGAGRVAEPVFYAYAVPEPRGFAEAEIRPHGAVYSKELREFVLPYERVRGAEEPEAALLWFMETTYQAGARGAGWAVEGLVDPHARVAGTLTGVGMGTGKG